MPLVDLPIIGSDDEDDKDDEKGAQDDEQMLTSPPVELAEGEVDGKDSDSEDSANEFVEVDADGKVGIFLSMSGDTLLTNTAIDT